MSETASQAAIINAAVHYTPGLSLSRYSLTQLNKLIEQALSDMSEESTVRYISYSRASTVTFARQALDSVLSELGHRASVARRAAKDADELADYAGRRKAEQLARAAGA